MANKFSIKSSKSSSKNHFFVLFFLISFTIYTFYCVYYQGSFVRNVGWRSKAEYPFSYYITLACGIIFPIGTIINIIWYNKKHRTNIVKKNISI